MRHEFSIVVDEAVVEVELRIGQLSAKDACSALLGGAVGIKGCHGGALPVDVCRVRAIIGEFSVVFNTNVIRSGCCTSSQGEQAKEE